jgi:hypothetical protein
MSPSEEDELTLKNVCSALGILAYGLRDLPYSAPELRGQEMLTKLALNLHGKLQEYIATRFPPNLFDNEAPSVDDTAPF